MRKNIFFKSLVGKLIPNSFSLRYLARLPQFNAWLKLYVDEKCPHYPVREELYKHLYNEYVDGASMDYFEMGVWYGAAIKSWTQLDGNKDSRYFGFDTFQGLPEVWEGLTANAEVGTFNVGGSIENVKIEDQRVSLIEGLFQDTVPEFLESVNLSQAAVRVLHIDSDLYSSALYCLSKFDHILKQNDIIVFDELSSMDEFWALTDYSSAFRREYRVLGHAGDYYQCVAIQML